MKIVALAAIALGGFALGFNVGNIQTREAHKLVRAAISSIDECLSVGNECAAKLQACRSGIP